MPGGSFAQIGAVIRTERIYYGVSSSPANTEAFIESLSGHKSTWALAVTKFTVNASGTSKIYFARPTHFGAIDFTSSGFVGGFIRHATGISVTNSLGLVLLYDLYESVSAGLGTTTITATGTGDAYAGEDDDDVLDVYADNDEIVAGGDPVFA